MTIRDITDQYFQRRKLVTPTDSEALLWFLSEVGELVRAWASERDINLYDPKHTDPQHAVFSNAVEVGNQAEAIMRASQGERGWVRNNQNQKEQSVADESGDCLLMLDRVCKELGLPDPNSNMVAKMTKKGYPPDLD